MVLTEREKERRLGRGMMLGGVLVTLALFLLAAFTSSANYFFGIELAAYRFLSLSEGASPVWDWVLLVGASRWWAICVGFLILARVSFVTWKRRREHFGREAGYLLLALALSIGAALMLQEGAEEIERKAPWTLSQASGHEMDRAYDPDFIRFSRRSNLIEEFAFAWTFLALVLGFRFPFSCLLTLIGLCVYFLSRITLGLEWLSICVLSVALGVVAAGAWYSWLWKPRAWFEKKAEDIFVALFWRHLFPDGGEQLARTLTDEHSRELRARRRNANAARRERVWHRVAERDVLPLLAPNAMGYKITKDPPTEEAKLSASPFVRFLLIDDGPTFVIKMASRFGLLWWRRPGRIARFAQAARNAAVLQGFGVPVPHVLWASEKIEYGGFSRTFFSVEEFLDGKPVDGADRAQVIEFGRLIAVLHERKATVWGPPGVRIENVQPYALFHARPDIIMLLRRIARRFDVEFDDAEIEGLWRRCEVMLDAAAAAGVPWRLTHGDLTLQNVLRTADGRMRFIDFVDVRFDLAGPELLKIARIIARSGIEQRAAFWEEYFRSEKGMPWPEFLAQAPYALAQQAIRETAQGRVALTGGDDPIARREALLRRLKRVCSLTSDIFGATPAQTDWRTIDTLMGPIDAASGESPIRIDRPHPTPGVTAAPIHPTPRAHT